MTDVFDQINFSQYAPLALQQGSEFIELIPSYVLYDNERNEDVEIIPQNVTIFGLKQNIIEEEEQSSESSNDNSMNNTNMDTVPIIQNPAVVNTASSGLMMSLLKRLRLHKSNRDESGKRVLKHDIRVDIGPSRYKISAPHIKDVPDELDLYVPIRDRCLTEYIVLEGIIRVDPPDPNSVKQSMNSKTSPQLDTVINPNLRRLLRIKMEIVLLSQLINKRHDYLTSQVQSIPDLFTLSETDVLHIRKPSIENQMSWNVRPCIRPQPDDVKPQLRSFEDLSLLKDYCFKPSQHVVVAKVNLLARLDQTEAANLLCDPIGYLKNCVRYYQLSVIDLFNLFFNTDMHGKTTVARTCPCGRPLTQSGRQYIDHNEKCAFQTFVRQNIPSIYRGGAYAIPEREALTPSEKQYINSVIAKRLPSYAWIIQPDGSKRLEKRQNGHDVVVIDRVPSSRVDVHSRGCPSMHGSGKCTITTNQTMSETYNSMQTDST